jgi:hypothetical protein
MKQACIFMITLVVILGSSCRKSQFSTITRQTKNGKVVYANYYPAERSNISKGKAAKRKLKGPDAQKNNSGVECTKKTSVIGAELAEINPVQATDIDNLTASTSTGPMIITGNINLMVSGNSPVLSNNTRPGFNVAHLRPDTINPKKVKKEKVSVHSGSQVIFFKGGRKAMAKIISQSPDTLFYSIIKEQGVVRGVTMDMVDTIFPVPFGEQVIKFKTGKMERVNILSQTSDTLFYTLIQKPHVVRSSMMEQVDTIVRVKYYDSARGKVIDIRKNEPLSVIGFISSILGLVPFFGLPFAVLGFMFGMFALRKIRRNPIRYKGTKLAKASVVIGIAGMIAFIIVCIVSLASAFHSCDAHI